MEGYVVFSQRRSGLGRAGSQLYEGTRMPPSKADAVSRAARTSVAGQEEMGWGSAAIWLLPSQDRRLFQAGSERALAHVSSNEFSPPLSLDWF